MPSQRWSQLRLVLTRNSNGTMEWTLVFGMADGSRKWDKRLAWGRLECAPGSPSSDSPLAALTSALEALRRAG